ncbi:MAG: AarF/ABC1/UbiB kinase family protein, partial [Deltaproteobacteria bacterium]|nr:AarF/ABC1/UbiB kinase family protein [Deltaproteobacteria bacterium]
DELKDALSVLQTFAQPMPLDEVVETVKTELGEKADVLLLQFDREPVSAASIGQVHRARVGQTEVAVKIQYPDVKKAIEADFGPASAGTKLGSLFYPTGNVDGYVKEAKARFLEECDYIHEAHCQMEFASIYRGHPVLFVPRVFPDFCTRRILTTEWVNGMSFDAFLETNPTQEARNRLGEALFEFYLGSLFRHCMYNCDPHPGNYLFCEDGRIAMLDHGCTRQFEPSFVAALAHLTRAVHGDTKSQIHDALLRLNIVRVDGDYDYEVIRSFLRSFFGPMLTDAVTAVEFSNTIAIKEMFAKKQQLMKFALPGEFTFLFRIRFGAMSVLSRLGTEANWYRLEKKYVDDFAARHAVLMR